MFRFLGKAVARYWPIWLAAWGLLLGLGWAYAPEWEAVTKGGEMAFLPEDSPSRRAERLIRETFPDEQAGSSVVLVVARASAALGEQDRKFIAEVLTPRLKKIAEEAGGARGTVVRIRTLTEQGAGALLVSPDRRATLVVVELRPSFLADRSSRVAEKVEALAGDLRREGAVPEGLAVAVTGSATAGSDLRRAEMQSARAIEVWTVVVVVVLLLLLYRAPLAALIPLVTVFFAVRVALQLLALLAGAGALALYRDVRIFITVLVYGAGVDYCLFLIARYREELDGGADPRQAVAGAVGRVGGAVSASAAPVSCGIGMLSFARFGKIREAGLTIPLALFVALCGALTFTAPLLRLAGRWAFWPQPAAGDRAAPGLLRRLLGRHLLPDVWARLGPVLLRRPAAIWLASVAALTPFVVLALLHYNDQNYNPISDLPPGAPSTAGTRLLAKHFPPGFTGPVTVLLQNDRVDFAGEKGIGLVAQLTDRLRERKDALGLADVRSVAEPLGITPAAEEALAGISLPRQAVESVVRKRAVAHYVSHAGELTGHVTRMDLTLATDPFSRRGLDDLGRIEAALRDDLPAGLRDSRLAFGGPTAGERDLGAVKQADQGRIEVLVSVVVFGLLLLLLRRVVVSLYLVLSVLFSYLATLGVTFLVFGLLHCQDFAGLDWKVPIFLFTILVAVGEDYNIFLMTRVQEEQGRHGPLRGITEALARTGRVISGCGFIMAGTFASLLSGSLLAMKELGFALAFGVLLDALVVRPLLVPTFLILLQSGRLGRVGRYLAPKRGAGDRALVPPGAR